MATQDNGNIFNEIINDEKLTPGDKLDLVIEAFKEPQAMKDFKAYMTHLLDLELKVARDNIAITNIEAFNTVGKGISNSKKLLARMTELADQINNMLAMSKDLKAIYGFLDIAAAFAGISSTEETRQTIALRQSDEARNEDTLTKLKNSSDKAVINAEKALSSVVSTATTRLKAAIEAGNPAEKNKKTRRPRAEPRR